MEQFDLYPELTARCQDIELRCIPVGRLAELGSIVEQGLFPGGEEPTLGDWYDPQDLTASARRAMAFHLTALADTRPHRWYLPLGVYLHTGAQPQLIGVQGLHAERFANNRTVHSSSFLAPGHRGHGYGIAARQACLAVAFQIVGARWAMTAALAGNESSIGVSLACGYLNNGVTTTAPGFEGRLVRDFLLPQKTWEATTRPAVQLAGFDRWAAAAGVRPWSATRELTATTG